VGIEDNSPSKLDVEKHLSTGLLPLWHEIEPKPGTAVTPQSSGSEIDALRNRSYFWLPMLQPPTPKPGTAGTPQHREFYVSNSGNDNNPGTKEKPFKTIDKLNHVNITTGDSVFFHAGQKFDGNLVMTGAVKADGRAANADPWNAIVIGTYGGLPNKRATIDAHDGSAIFAKNLGGITLQNLDLHGDIATNNGLGVEVLNETTQRLNHVWVDNVVSSGFKWVGEYVGGSPVLPGLPMAKDKPNRWGFKDVLFSHDSAHDNTYFGIWASGPWEYSVTGKPQNLDPGYANENVQVRFSQAYDNPGDPKFKENHSGNGILIDDTKGYRYEFNLTERNGLLNGSQSGGPVGAWSNQSTEGLFAWNISCNNGGNLTDGDGFDADGGVSKTIFEHNLTCNNQGAGILEWSYWGTLRPTENNIFRNNASINDGRKFNMGGIDIGNSGDGIGPTDVYRNLVFMSKGGPVPATGEPLVLWEGGNPGAPPNKNVRYWDNILIAGKDVPLVNIEPDSDATFNHNLYLAPPGQFKVTYHGKTYTSLISWLMAERKEQQAIAKANGANAK